jgi:hypothetical protein
MVERDRARVGQPVRRALRRGSAVADVAVGEDETGFAIVVLLRRHAVEANQPAG